MGHYALIAPDRLARHAASAPKTGLRHIVIVPVMLNHTKPYVK